MNFKIVEKKGDGHPDTLTDILVEMLTRVVENYSKQIDKYIHYNLDKALFVGGDAIIDFNKYELIKKPLFIVSGNISYIDDILLNNMKEVIVNYLYTNFNKMEIDVEFRLANASMGLNNIGEKILAGDTSYAVAHFPLFNYERRVLDIDNYLISFKKEYPIGADWKIMYRQLQEKYVNISVPLLIDEVTNEKIYKDVVNELNDYLSKAFTDIYFVINSDISNNNYWLLKYGTSVESGDCGQVGRGNRLNGLITPMSAMTLEAYHGKNNHNHTGKILQNEAKKVAREIFNSEGKTVEVVLVSRIGQPIEDYELYYKLID